VVVRILVNAAIKKAACREAGTDHPWLYKVRPWYGHAAHFHVQIACPADSADCKPPVPPPAGASCGSDLDVWFGIEAAPAAGQTAAGLDVGRVAPACRQIVKAP